MQHAVELPLPHPLYYENSIEISGTQSRECLSAWKRSTLNLLDQHTMKSIPAKCFMDKPSSDTKKSCKAKATRRVVAVRVDGVQGRWSAGFVLDQLRPNLPSPSSAPHQILIQSVWSNAFGPAVKFRFVGISSSSSSSKHSRIFRNNKIHRAEQHQAFQKILRLDESKFLSYASTTKMLVRINNHFHQAFQKILRLDKSAFLSYASTTKCSYASITTSIKRFTTNTTQTTPVDPQQQASTHSSRPVNIQLLTSHHYTTRTWKINQPDEPATHCRIQRPSEHSRTTSQQHTAASRDLLNIAECRASDTLPYPETAERHTFAHKYHTFVQP
ncbi:uncharacterized protein LOC143909206 [Arctopsyche grandis]|uniref:uncharacterized protein LOC143909206 n=1 Tax=Arctopsyche grandis TaxID=121162 RepID=UPI00406D6861